MSKPSVKYDEAKEIIFEILLTNPVSDFLQLTAYTVSLVETIPIVSIQPIPVEITQLSV